MTKDEALKLALEALDGLSEPYDVLKAQEAIKEALALSESSTKCEETSHAQPEQNEFNPDWDAMAVMVEEQQRMAKRIAELEAQRKPLTDEELRVIENKINPNLRWRSSDEEGITFYPQEYYELVRAIEAKHGIKE